MPRKIASEVQYLEARPKIKGKNFSYNYKILQRFMEVLL